MRYSREYLDRLAGTTGFPPDTLEKVLRLERMLTLVGEHPFLGPRVVLKGGTALNLFYQQAPRLSVDLDFNYIGSADRTVLLKERPDLERAVEQLAAGEEYQLQRAPEEHAGRKFYLGYRNAFGTPDRIEVDLNYLFRVPLAPPIWREGWTPDPDVACRGHMAAVDEVMAGKLLALLDRVAARDLYDVAQFAQMPPADPVAFRRLFIALSGVLPSPLTAYDTRHLRAFTQIDLDRQLVPFLRREVRVTPEVLEAQAARVLAPLLDLSAPEREYVERLQWGEFHPEMITGDIPEFVERLRIHPALLWKIQNAKMRPRR